MRTVFWIGGYASPEEEGLHRYVFDPETGLTELRAYTGLNQPSFVLRHPDHPVLYSVEETMEGAVCAWKVDGEELTLLATVPTGGGAPCHLALSEDGRWLYAANYMGGSLACFSLDADGVLTGRSDLRQHEGKGPNPVRQEGPHAHFSTARNGEQLVCDLGLDAIVRYRNEGGALTEVGRIPAPAGYGPRHLAQCPAHPELLYCVTELASHVLVYKEEAGTYTLLQDLPMLPADYDGRSIAAAIKFSADGRFLLASNRGHDSIAAFPVQTDGSLGECVISPCVREPRDFLTTGDFVIIGSQRDSQIRAYRLREDGALVPMGEPCPVQKPVCFQPIPE